MELAIFEILLLRLPELSTLKIESLARLLIYKVYKGVWTGGRKQQLSPQLFSQKWLKKMNKKKFCLKEENI